MNKYIILSLLFLILIFSCNKNNQKTDDNIPQTVINFSINLNLPTYNHLNNLGTWVYEDYGSKGVVIIHHIDDVFYAFDRTCSYNPLNPCSKIEVDTTMLNLRCGKTENNTFNACCGSKFNFEGYPISGSASRNLRQLYTQKLGNVINISSF